MKNEMINKIKNQINKLEEIQDVEMATGKIDRVLNISSFIASILFIFKLS